MIASHPPPTGDLARNPGMYPDWESNRGPFVLQANTQSTEPHQPGHLWLFCTVEMITAALSDSWDLKIMGRAVQWVLWVIRWGTIEPILK